MSGQVEYETPPAIDLLYQLVLMTRINPVAMLATVPHLVLACVSAALPDDVVVVLA